jgi:hypothetical protein
MNYWNNERMTLLHRLYPSAQREEILTVFPERNWNAIAAKATRERIGRIAPMRRLNPKEYPVLDTESRKIAAWSIAFEGAIGLNKLTPTRYMAQRRPCRYIELAPAITLGNTNQELLTKFSRLMNGYGKVDNGRDNSLTKNGTIYSCKPLWRWSIRGVPETQGFLQQILPFLPAKKKQGELLLEYTVLRLSRWRLPYSEREFEIYEEIKRLNQRGQHELT